VSTLFDISQQEPARDKKTRSRRPATSDGGKANIAPIYRAETPAKAIRALGKLDHTHECADALCRGSAHDIIHEDRGEWLIQCCFCLTCQWVPVIEGHLEPKSTEFQFRDGRFAGLTIDEAVALPRGLEYVLWAAREHKRPAVKTACETWLAKNQPSR
jgi:hypothetical protein